METPRGAVYGVRVKPKEVVLRTLMLDADISVGGANGGLSGTRSAVECHTPQ